MALLVFPIRVVHALAPSQYEAAYGANSYFLHEAASVDNERRSFAEKHGSVFPVQWTCAPSHVLPDYYLGHQGTQLETTVRSKSLIENVEKRFLLFVSWDIKRSEVLSH